MKRSDEIENKIDKKNCNDLPESVLNEVSISRIVKDGACLFIGPVLFYFNNCTNVRFSISLDPEEDIQDPELFAGLAKFLDEDLDSVEREQVFTKTIPRMVERAKSLRSTKPPQGLHYSLQQQGKTSQYLKKKTNKRIKMTNNETQIERDLKMKKE